jgi:hypothetical protein
MYFNGRCFNAEPKAWNIPCVEMKLLSPFSLRYNVTITADNLSTTCHVKITISEISLSYTVSQLCKMNIKNLCTATKNVT